MWHKQVNLSIKKICLFYLIFEIEQFFCLYLGQVIKLVSQKDQEQQKGGVPVVAAGFLQNSFQVALNFAPNQFKLCIFNQNQLLIINKYIQFALSDLVELLLYIVKLLNFIQICSKIQINKCQQSRHLLNLDPNFQNKFVNILFLHGAYILEQLLFFIPPMIHNIFQYLKPSVNQFTCNNNNYFIFLYLNKNYNILNVRWILQKTQQRGL
eukprot:TRINITY_DN7684_c0_g1_i3.p2 TRINITY_DN7684_c0_g1~~TRINITY_DN7684_c0_g1_i3.p2  ORF type:complete len:210 (-),score=3.45 TRINITY_DN7684_c0_g1_i3:273-902(-)